MTTETVNFIYAELMEGDNPSKRYVFPQSADIESKLKTYVSQNPHVRLIRTGTATATSESSDDSAIADQGKLDTIPANVDKVYQVIMQDHPVLIGKESAARYSQELIDAVKNVKVEIEVVKQQALAPVVDKKQDLTQQLKNQLSQEKIESETKHTSLTDQLRSQMQPDKQEDAPPPGQMTLEEAVVQSRQQQPDKNHKLSPKPIGKIDKLLREVEDLRQEVRALQQLLTEQSANTELLTELRAIKQELIGGE